MCGGTLPQARRAVPHRGLSPRVRGNPPGRPGTSSGRGSIPACAGEPRHRRRQRPAGQVYPRVCGGTSSVTIVAGGGSGLSPRVRGNRRTLSANTGRAGSIPACAGEPRRTRRQQSPLRVYPRVCGGTEDGSGLRSDSRGLSPRVRGNRVGFAPVRGGGGAIPACAGEPITGNAAGGANGVYPRVCGGTLDWSGRHCYNCGLSPRVRGNHWLASGVPMNRGSIPACAGEPCRRRSSRYCATVYPRVCGGTRRATIRSASVNGLSPRVRGNPVRQGQDADAQRSIPACAGEPEVGHQFTA